MRQAPGDMQFRVCLPFIMHGDFHANNRPTCTSAAPVISAYSTDQSRHLQCWVCVMVEFEKKQVYLCSVHIKSVSEQGYFHEFAFDDKALKTFVNFRIRWKRSKFERCRIRSRTSSHLYSEQSTHQRQ